MYFQAQALYHVGDLYWYKRAQNSKTVGGMDAAAEHTGMYSLRVLEFWARLYQYRSY